MGTYENGGQVRVFMHVEVPNHNRMPDMPKARCRKVTLFSAYASSPEESGPMVLEFFKANPHIRQAECHSMFVPYPVWL